MVSLFGGGGERQKEAPYHRLYERQRGFDWVALICYFFILTAYGLTRAATLNGSSNMHRPVALLKNGFVMRTKPVYHLFTKRFRTPPWLPPLVMLINLARTAYMCGSVLSCCICLHVVLSAHISTAHVDLSRTCGPICLLLGFLRTVRVNLSAYCFAFCLNVDVCVHMLGAPGPRATIHACTLENDCMVGAGATVMDGATVSSGAMVAPGATVSPNTNVPAGQVRETRD